MKTHLGCNGKMDAIKLGVIYLGRNFGKDKFSLVDERDIDLVSKHMFELHLEASGNDLDEVCSYAVTKATTAGRKFLHDLVWEEHCGSVVAGGVVAHKNGITLDNRLSNLEIFPTRNKCPKPPPRTEMPHTMYWQALHKLPPIQQDDHDYGHELVSTVLSANGELVEIRNSPMFYECHNLPCLCVEKHLDQFSSCPRCRVVRYCCEECMEMHSVKHKAACKCWLEKEHTATDCDLPDR